MNSFPVYPSILFVGHPNNDNNEGFIIDYADSKFVIDEMFKKYEKKCYEKEMKLIMYNELKKFEISPMTKTEYKSSPKPKIYQMEF